VQPPADDGGNDATAAGERSHHFEERHSPAFTPGRGVRRTARHRR
jgi:hypothetical protein